MKRLRIVLTSVQCGKINEVNYRLQCNSTILFIGWKISSIHGTVSHSQYISTKVCILDKHDEILVAIRQIIRAIDLHSKKLSKEYGLTGPQLILMRNQEMGNVTIKELSNQTNVSQATTTTIIDRLELNGYVQRIRSVADRRKVHANLTEKGKRLLTMRPHRYKITSLKNSKI